MANPTHGKQTTADGIHTAVSYTYANSAARTGATGFTSQDVGKISWQLDNNSLWLLLNTTPTWTLLAGLGSIGASGKAGIVVPGSFSGNPKTATVTFSTAYPSASYAVTAVALTDGAKSFIVDVESKTSAGFTLNLYANNIAHLVEVDWYTTMIGE
jgi:hypothetical protein